MEILRRVHSRIHYTQQIFNFTPTHKIHKIKNTPTFNYQNYQMNALAFSDIQKHKLQTFNNRLKELDNEHNHIMKCRKQDDPDFPEDPDSHYMDWRASYLMQVELSAEHTPNSPDTSEDSSDAPRRSLVSVTTSAMILRQKACLFSRDTRFRNSHIETTKASNTFCCFLSN